MKVQQKNKVFFCLLILLIAVVSVFAFGNRALASDDYYDSNRQKGQIGNNNVEVWSNDELEVTSAIDAQVDPVSGDTNVEQTIHFKNLTEDKKIVFNKISAILNSGFESADIDIWTIKSGDKTIFEGSGGGEFIPDLSIVPSGEATYNVETALTGSKAGLLANTTPFKFVYDYCAKPIAEAYACVYTSEGGSLNDTLEFRYDDQRNSEKWTETFDCLNTGNNKPDWAKYVGDGQKGTVKYVNVKEEFNNVKPKSMYRWFAANNSNSSLEVVNNANYLNTSEAINISYIFDYCSNLTIPPDTSNWNTTNVTNMSYMFRGCTSLQTPPDTSNWNTTNVTNMSYMFQFCSNIQNPPDVSNWDTSKVIDMKYMFARCASLVVPADVSNWNTSNVTNMSYMFYHCDSMQTPPDTSIWQTGKVKNMSAMFSYCSNMQTPPDTSAWNTSNVTDMRAMFERCTSMRTPPDVSNWNTSKVITISCMFLGNDYVGDMKINYLDVSKWKTTNMKDMTCAFYGCGALEFLDVSNWDTSNCQSFNHMFCDNFKLKSLDLSKWNTKSLLTCYDMFDDCRSLKTIGDISSWKTENLKDFGGFLNGCSSFDNNGEVFSLSGWSNKNMIVCGEAFRACPIKTIDLTGWSFEKISDTKWSGTGSGIYYETGQMFYPGLSAMFTGCSQLTTIYCETDASNKIASSGNMFSGCSKLPHWDTDSGTIDKTYAYPDNGIHGFFTPKTPVMKLNPFDGGHYENESGSSINEVTGDYGTTKKVKIVVDDDTQIVDKVVDNTGKEYSVDEDGYIDVELKFNGEISVNTADKITIRFHEFDGGYYEDENGNPITEISKKQGESVNIKVIVLDEGKKVNAIIDNFGNECNFDENYVFSVVFDQNKEILAQLKDRFEAYACIYSDKSKNDTLEFRYDDQRDSFELTFECEDTGLYGPGWADYIGGSYEQEYNTVTTVNFTSNFNENVSVKSCANWFAGSNGSSTKIIVFNDINYFDTSNVTTMNSMFAYCSSMQTPPDTSNWNTSKVTNMNSMFRDCTNMQTPPNTSAWNTSQVKNMSYMFDNCTSLTSPPNVSHFDTSNVTNIESMFWDCRQMQTPPNTSSWDTQNVNKLSNMFYNCQSMQTPPDTSNWNISQVTDMSYMFGNCQSLQTPPDMSNWDTSKVTDMRIMLSGCHSMQTPPNTSNWDTQNVTDMSDMFYNCQSMQTPPDTSNWNISQVKNMSYMFYNCHSMQTPPDTSNWNTSNLWDVEMMFAYCSNMQTPPDTSNWNTSNLADMINMFAYCSSMQTPPDMSNWDTSKIFRTQGMFCNCNKIKEVDISAFIFTSSVWIGSNTESWSYDFGMFENCTQLNKIYYNSDISNIIPLEHSYRTFYGCQKLPNYQKGDYYYGGDLAKPASMGGVFTPKESVQAKKDVSANDEVVVKSQQLNQSDSELQAKNENIKVDGRVVKKSTDNNKNVDAGAGLVAASVVALGAGFVGSRKRICGKHVRLK